MGAGRLVSSNLMAAESTEVHEGGLVASMSSHGPSAFVATLRHNWSSHVKSASR